MAECACLVQLHRRDRFVLKQQVADAHVAHVVVL